MSINNTTCYLSFNKNGTVDLVTISTLADKHFPKWHHLKWLKLDVEEF